jgi:hypothetical protein
MGVDRTRISCRLVELIERSLFAFDAMRTVWFT